MSAARAGQAARLRAPHPLAAFLLVAAVLCLPFALTAHLPLVDLPNHMARHFIAANPGSALEAYYTYEFSARANSAADLLWLWAGRHLMEVEPFSRLVFAIYAVNLVAAAMTLSRVIHGRWSLWPLGSALVVFNAPFFWGFQNFLFTVPFALHALALWLAMERRAAWMRAAVFTPLCLGLFQMHLLGFAVLLFAAFGRETQRLLGSGGSWRTHLRGNLVSAVPFLTPLGLVLYWALAAPPNAYGDVTIFGGLGGRVQALLSAVHVPTVEGNAALHLLSLLLLALLAALFATLARRQGARLSLAPQAWGPVLALAVLSACAPLALDGVFYVNIRFPFVLAVLLFAGTVWRELSCRAAAGIALALAIVGGARLALIEREAAAYAADVETLEEVLDAVPPGARLLPVRMSPPGAAKALWHLQAYAVPKAQAFVPTLFLGVHALKVRPDWRDIAVPQGMSLPAPRVLDPERLEKAKAAASPPYWADWPARFTHVLAFDPLPETLTAPHQLEEAARRGRFTLLRIPKRQ